MKPLDPKFEREIEISLVRVWCGKKQHLHCQRLLSSNVLSDQITELWPGNSSGRQKMHTKIICFCSIALQEACSTQYNLNKRGLDLDKYAICVRIAQRESITCSFIMQWPRSYGICSAAFLTYNGSCHKCQRSLHKLEYMEN